MIDEVECLCWAFFWMMFVWVRKGLVGDTFENTDKKHFLKGVFELLIFCLVILVVVSATAE